MEYGYEITDTGGTKRFFVEGCTYCSLSTGGEHEYRCPCRQDESQGIIHSIYNILYSVWEADYKRSN